MADSPLVILQKPKFREPCNRCGECCRHQACEASEQLLHSSQAPCIALEFDGGEFSCGLVKRPHFYFGLAWSGEDCRKFDDYMGPLVAKYIGTGQGCGMPDEEIANGQRSAPEGADDLRTEGNDTKDRNLQNFPARQVENNAALL